MYHKTSSSLPHSEVKSGKILDGIYAISILSYLLKTNAKIVRAVSKGEEISEGIFISPNLQKKWTKSLSNFLI